MGTTKKANFFNMTAWGKTAEAMEKNVRKGTKIVVECEANQNSYTDKNGNKVNAIDFRVISWEFAESKSSQQSAPKPMPDNDGFMNIPDNIDEDNPFN